MEARSSERERVRVASTELVRVGFRGSPDPPNRAARLSLAATCEVECVLRMSAAEGDPSRCPARS